MNNLLSSNANLPICIFFYEHVPNNRLVPAFKKIKILFFSINNIDSIKEQTLKKMAEFDIFISYNWEIKEQVKFLYKKLTEDYLFNCWIDEKSLTHESLYNQIASGIKNSSIFLCCVTKKYSESANCEKEITFANELQKPLIVLMMERIELRELGAVGFIISPKTRFMCYKEPEMFNNSSSKVFDTIIKSIKMELNSSNNSNENKKTNFHENFSNKEIIFSKNHKNEIRKMNEFEFISNIDKNNETYINDLIKTQLKELLIYSSDFQNIKKLPNFKEIEDTIHFDSIIKSVKYQLGISSMYNMRYKNDIKLEFQIKELSIVKLKEFLLNHHSNENKIENNINTRSANNNQAFVPYLNGIYMGGIVNGNRHGFGTLELNDGTKYTGEWKDDKQNGKGHYIYYNGDEYEGDFVNDKKHGKGIYKFINGNSYEGDYFEDSQTGYGVFIWSNGDKYYGEFLNNQKHGKGKIEFKNGTISNGEWRNNVEIVNYNNQFPKNDTSYVRQNPQSSVQSYSYKAPTVNIDNSPKKESHRIFNIFKKKI